VRTPQSLLIAAAVTTALGGVVAVTALQPTAAPAVSAQSAVAPVPVDLAGESALVAQHKAHTRAGAEAARTAAAEAAAKAAREKAAAERARQRASRASRISSADPRSIARALLAERGQADQFGCLDSLWQKESGWRVRATNPSSGAYGIPQALPAGKMASAGSDWRTNARTQIVWGLGYINDRYGSPCGAWAHSRSHNWY